MLIQNKDKWCDGSVNPTNGIKNNYIRVENISEIENNSHRSKSHCFQEIH